MTVPAVVSLATLGVTDLARSTHFYLDLGFPLSPASVEGEVSFFRTAGGILALWGVEDLRADAGLAGAADPPAAGAFRGVALAVNVADRATVDTSLAAARAAGAGIPRPAAATDWGGYQGYFTDPDGHLWEVAHNPGWPLGPDGLPQLP